MTIQSYWILFITNSLKHGVKVDHQTLYNQEWIAHDKNYVQDLLKDKGKLMSSNDLENKYYIRFRHMESYTCSTTDVDKYNICTKMPSKSIINTSGPKTKPSWYSFCTKGP
jgi:hypothetical protein